MKSRERSEPAFRSVPLQDNLFKNAPPRQIKTRTPHLPSEDNTPEGLQALLEANRHYRGVSWPEPFHKTRHQLTLGDARDLSWIKDSSVHLIVTSPPYWTLKKYATGNDAQMG